MTPEELEKIRKDYLDRCEQIQACLLWAEPELANELLRAKSKLDADFAPIREALFDAEGRHDPILEKEKT